jgi:hypothetical protein
MPSLLACCGAINPPSQKNAQYASFFFDLASSREHSFAHPCPAADMASAVRALYVTGNNGA